MFKILFLYNRDYVQYIQKNYNNEELLRDFYAFGEWSLDERPIAEKFFQNAVTFLLMEPDEPWFSWALKIVSDHYSVSELFFFMLFAHFVVLTFCSLVLLYRCSNHLISRDTGVSERLWVKSLDEPKKA